jgi:hypothetical protein
VETFAPGFTTEVRVKNWVGFLADTESDSRMMERGSVTCRGYFGREGAFWKSEWQGEKVICLFLPRNN